MVGQHRCGADYLAVYSWTASSRSRSRVYFLVYRRTRRLTSSSIAKRYCRGQRARGSKRPRRVWPTNPVESHRPRELHRRHPLPIKSGCSKGHGTIHMCISTRDGVSASPLRAADLDRATLRMLEPTQARRTGSRPQRDAQTSDSNALGAELQLHVYGTAMRACL